MEATQVATTLVVTTKETTLAAAKRTEPIEN
jgi:hypothetical protein